MVYFLHPCSIEYYCRWPCADGDVVYDSCGYFLFTIHVAYGTTTDVAKWGIRCNYPFHVMEIRGKRTVYVVDIHRYTACDI